MKRRWIFAGLGAAVCGALAAIALGVRGAERIGACAEARRPAAIYPGYSGLVIPRNIAPLNLKVLEPGVKFCLRLSGPAGEAVEIFSANGAMRIPQPAWRKLLAANAGASLSMDVYAKTSAGWTHFEPERLEVSPDEIDPYVVYRYIPPIYDKWGRISIVQRDLASFREQVLIDNERSRDPSGKTAGNACVNCHAFLNHRTGRMLLHSRPGGGAGQIPAMILVRDGRATKLDTRVEGRGPASYISWHPSGKLLAFSRNSLFQIFHSAGEDVREVVDRDSDLGLYDVEADRTFTAPQISRPDRLETWPAWSPDGRHLYFSSARQSSTDRKAPPPDWASIRYDLARVSFDLATGRWGEAETVVAAAQLGLSVSMPQISPDGRYVMFCGHRHGSFPTFQTSSDLYLLDLRAAAPFLAAARRLDEINSERSDSYHSWSSTSRWVIFSSKREDGVYTRLYLTHLDSGGRFSRPFVVPQEDPEFYGRCLMSFNRAEMIAEPAAVPAAELVRAINAPGGGAPRTQPAEEPWQPLLR